MVSSLIRSTGSLKLRISSFVLVALTSSTIISGGTVLKGTVTDTNGGAIPGATIRFHWDPAGSTVGLATNVGIKTDVIIRSDDTGSFAAELPPGFYDVFVSAMAFTPTCRKVRILQPAGTGLIFLMQVDPLVTQELGDKMVVLPHSDNNANQKHPPVH